MAPLAALAIIIYLYALELLVYFKRTNYPKADNSNCEKWVEHPTSTQGALGEIIQYSQQNIKSIKDIQSRFSEINAAHLPRIERRILFLSVLVTIAPLMGLLGTVTGMLATFKGMAISSGKLIDVVASGISEALITTQTGLIIAIPGYILVNALYRKNQELAALLGRLESLTVQLFSRKQAR